MPAHWTRRQFLSRVGIVAAAIQTLDHLDLCCALAGDAKTAAKDLFELKPVADGVYAAIAAIQYKVNSNAAVILTNDGVMVVDSHSKPSAPRALYNDIRGLTKNPVRKVINTHFHWVSIIARKCPVIIGNTVQPITGNTARSKCWPSWITAEWSPR
jgi:Metallo-beta-lactamase superfamily